MRCLFFFVFLFDFFEKLRKLRKTQKTRKIKKNIIIIDKIKEEIIKYKANNKITLSELPETPDNTLFTLTKIIDMVLPPIRHNSIVTATNTADKEASEDDEHDDDDSGNG